MSDNNSVLSSAQTAKQRNIANNANNIRVAADVASKTSNPYAKAAGMAIKAADKISGGKASERLGKALNTMNKMNGLQGRMMQSALNKMSESGASNKIGSAINAKNGNSSGKSPKMGGMGAAASKNTMTSVKDKNDGESNDSGTATFAGSFKVVKYGLIGLAVFFPIIICCLFMASSQIYGNAVSLGTADSLREDEVEEKINKKMKESPEDLDEEITDERLEDNTAFGYDIYITDNKSQILKNNKLYDVNVVQVADIFTFFKRKYNEATLDRIEEFFPAVVDESKNYDQNMVYDFYFKMYNLYMVYKTEYKVNLDLPLLMATLNLQSADKNVIFSSNMDSRYRTNNENDIPKNELDYYYDWTKTDYKISRNNSEHDMELLAQNMVSKQVKELCKDSSGKTTKENILRDGEIGTQTLTCAEGETYEITEASYEIDTIKYKEFLKEFLEKKYYLEGEHDVTTSNPNDNDGDNIGNNDGSSSGNNTGNNNAGNNTGNNSGNSTENDNKYPEGKVSCGLTIIGDTYYRTKYPLTSKCNVSKFDTPKGLEPKFYQNVKNLIAYAKSKGCNAELGSAYRSFEKQQYFYNCYINKNCNNGNLAAKPGKSNHQYGIAVDLKYRPKTQECLQLYKTSAADFGLDFPLWDHKTHPENWHIEPINVINGKPKEEL